MFRIAPAACNARFLLTYRPSQLCLAISKLSQTSLRHPKKMLEREPCPPPPPPPPPPSKDRRLMWGALIATAMTGAFIVYAKDTPEIRDWLTLYLPWFDDAIAAIYQEDMTFQERADMWSGYLQDCWTEYFSKERAERLKRCALDGDNSVAAIKPPEESVPAKPCKKKPPPVIEKDICKLEKCINELGETVIENFTVARDGAAYYNNFVQEVMTNFSIDSIKELEAAKKDRIAINKEAIENVNDASKKFDDLQQYIICGVEAPPDVLDKTRQLFDNFNSRIRTACIQYQLEHDRALSFDDSLSLVIATMKKFIDENQILFPGLDYGSRKPALTGDGDLYLHHASRYIKKLRQDVDDASDAMTDKISRSFDVLPQGPKDKFEREQLIQAMYKAKKGDLEKEFVKKYADLTKDMDDMLKTAIKKQLDTHEANLKMKLQQREDELMANMDKLVGERVANEKEVFKKQLSEMAAKVQLVENKINAKLKAERESRMSQELYMAAAALMAATKRGEPCVCVQKELKAIEKAGGQDKLVEAVLKAIPDAVREQGVTPESVLRQKYHAMESVALKVALVEHDGAPLPVYFLSWLQSMLLFMKLSSIPRAEFESPPKEPQPHLDTFDLLQRARFWIDRGDIALAWRYVSALEGASRGAAETWLRSATAFLRTRQACDTLLAHAAALAVKYM